MAYDDEGQGSLTVILLHGFPLNRSMWREQVEALSARAHVVAPDLRGLGETTVTHGAATMEEMARDVAALMDELAIEQAILAGLSMGGYVALAFYHLFPGRVRALVLADTRAQADTEEARENREKLAQRALKEGMSPIIDAMLLKLLAPATLKGRPETVARVREMMAQTSPAGAAAALRGMAVRYDQTGFLPEIASPALIIVGSEDQITPPADAETMHHKITGSHLVAIEGAGHMSNIEHPAEFNNRLGRFLDRIEKPTNN